LYRVGSCVEVFCGAWDSYSYSLVGNGKFGGFAFMVNESKTMYANRAQTERSLALVRAAMIQPHLSANKIAELQKQGMRLMKDLRWFDYQEKIRKVFV
jgi:hypothetical protein